MPSAVSTAIYAASVAPLADAQLYAAALAAVSPQRRAKAERYHFEKDRRLSLGAEVLLRHALRSAGAPERELRFTYGAQEKPYLGGGVWFNLSHSGESVLCAVSDCEVGCDVEQVTEISLRIAERFFFRGEYDDIAAQPSPEARNDRFFRYWTLKESFMKVTGLGMKLPLDEFQICLGGGISVLQSVDERMYFFREYDGLPGYKCAMCTADGPCADVLQTVDLAALLQAVV